MIEVVNLSKRYGKHLAVKDISFQVNDGEILGFLGPNGAGKSTTMNILTGYLSSNQGTVRINGYDILESPDNAKKHIGYLPEQPPLYPDMTVKEYLSFIFELKKVKLPKAPHIEEICRLVKIDDIYSRLIANLSKGYKQRVGIAQALIGNPDVLILDEPTVGLDPKQIIEIRNLIHQLGKNHTVILSSHILPEIQAVCQRVIVINKGQIVADDTPENLASSLSSDLLLTVRIQGPKADVTKLLSTIPGVKAVTFVGPRETGAFEFEVEPVKGTDIRKIMFDRLADRHWPLLSSTTNALSLEQIFIRLTDGTDDDIIKRALINRKSAEAAKADDEADERMREVLESRGGTKSAEADADAPADESLEETESGDASGKEGK